MTYFYDYFAKEYRKKQKNKQIYASGDMLQIIGKEERRACRRTLKNAFAGYRDGKNLRTLQRLLGEYREYIAGLYDEHAKDRYNAFVYRYMVSEHVGIRAIAAKLGVSKDSVYNYINRSMDEILMLCMGVPVTDLKEGEQKFIHVLIEGNRIFSNMADEYILCLFHREREQTTVKQGRQFTKCIMTQLDTAVEAYINYCNDEETRIDTDIRKARILQKCLEGVSITAIAEEYGVHEGTIYADVKENERRLAALLFDIQDVP